MLYSELNDTLCDLKTSELRTHGTKAFDHEHHALMIPEVRPQVFQMPKMQSQTFEISEAQSKICETSQPKLKTLELPNLKPQTKGFATRSIHVGQDPDQWMHKAVIPPIVTSTTFKQTTPAEPFLFEYSRTGNPTRSVLENCLASLDNGKHALTFSSGLGVTTVITQLLSAGDHIISCDNIYGGTYRFLTEVLTRQGVTLDTVDISNLDILRNTIKSNTRMIWFESPTNPCMKVLDIEAISRLAHSYGNILVVIDNTFLTPYFQRPLELGVDIVAYSVSKYLNGHSDVIMGAAVVKDKELYERLKFLQNATGVIPSPFDCYQVNRGLKTLKIRMEQHYKNSVAVARFLESNPNVERVLHPALKSHPDFEITVRQTYGHSGIMSFYLKGGYAEAKRLFQSLKLFTLAESLGGYESLISLPSRMSHAALPEEVRKSLGITDSLIRLSVGLEDVEDLIADLSQALSIAFYQNGYTRYFCNF